jgi:hypothetical protein
MISNKKIYKHIVIIYIKMEFIDNEILEKRRKNREYMKEYQQRCIYYKCECGGSIFKQYNKAVHNKCNKHKEFILVNPNPKYTKINMEKMNNEN